LRNSLHICGGVLAVACGAAILPSLDQMAPPIRGLTLAELHDTFNEIHNGHPHEAIDIPEPRNTPVLAGSSGDDP